MIVVAILRRATALDFQTAQAARLDGLDDQAVLGRKGELCRKRWLHSSRPAARAQEYWS